MYPSVLNAVTFIICVPGETFLPCHVKEQELELLHVARGAPSPLRVMDVIPFVSLAEAAILMAELPLNTVPFAGEVIETLGGVGDDGAYGAGGGTVVVDVVGVLTGVVEAPEVC